MDFNKQHNIETCVVACILDDAQRVLLTRRNIEPFVSQWVMPGGKVDFGEALLAALHREVREEVGIEIQVEELIDVFEHLGAKSGGRHFVILYYRAHPRGLELVPNQEECGEARWVAADELSALDLPPGTRHILSKLFPSLGWGNGAPPARQPEQEVHHSPGSSDSN